MLEISPNCEHAMISGAFTTAFHNTIICRPKNAKTISKHKQHKKVSNVSFFCFIKIVIVSTFIECMIFFYHCNLC